jgi:hypothetical protein
MLPIIELKLRLCVRRPGGSLLAFAPSTVSHILTITVGRLLSPPSFTRTTNS